MDATRAVAKGIGVTLRHVWQLWIEYSDDSMIYLQKAKMTSQPCRLRK